VRGFGLAYMMDIEWEGAFDLDDGDPGYDPLIPSRLGILT
jgi:hypothetical protein